MGTIRGLGPSLIPSLSSHTPLFTTLSTITTFSSPSPSTFLQPSLLLPPHPFVHTSSTLPPKCHHRPLPSAAAAAAATAAATILEVFSHPRAAGAGADLLSWRGKLHRFLYLPGQPATFTPYLFICALVHALFSLVIKRRSRMSKKKQREEYSRKKRIIGRRDRSERATNAPL